MHLVVVSSAGHGPQPHWSRAAASALAAAAMARGLVATWLAPHFADQPPPAPPAGVALTALAVGPPPSLATAAANSRQLLLEVEVTRVLRASPRAVVAHVGVGAFGSPNVLWLADRLGSRAFAVLRGAEVVCARGDLVDRDGAACREHSDPERCRWCCRTGWRRRPRASELESRVDLLTAGLLVAEVIGVDDAHDVALLRELGVPDSRIVVGRGPDDLVARMAGPADARP